MYKISILLNLFCTVASLDLCSENNNENVNNYTFVKENYTIANCGCSHNGPCITKCCKPGFYFKNHTCIRHGGGSSSSPLSVAVCDHETNVVVEYYEFPQNFKVASLDCTYFVLKPHLNESDKFYIKSDGQLWYPHGNLHYQNDEYCIENTGNDRALEAYICAPEERTFIEIGMIISMPFLLATLIVYALLPERNLHMKALMFYVFSLLCAYIFLVILQLNEQELAGATCQTLAYSTLFFFMASFLWMNVICIDIWFTFSGLRGFHGSKRSAERKRLLMYCAYAWGLTIVLTGIVFLVNTFGDKFSWYHPGIGQGQCWFNKETGYIELMYFYGPMAVIIVTNVVLFCLTAYKIKQSQNDTKMLRREDSKKHISESDQQKFYLYLKLFLAMGVNWAMEFISWLVEWKIDSNAKYLFYLTDFCNAIYGVFIFIMFVCKKKIWSMLKKRYYNFIGKPFLARETTSNRVQSSNFSGTESTTFTEINDPSKESSRPLRMSSLR